jgi:hypothetical protein
VHESEVGVKSFRNATNGSLNSRIIHFQLLLTPTPGKEEPFLPKLNKSKLTFTGAYKIRVG